MKKAAEYRQHARECRELAQRMPQEDQRVQLLTMAEQWEKLAVERERLTATHPELSRSRAENE
jgi:hypothetical protein